MLSWRLWRTIAEADIDDPIFRRVSQIQRLSVRSMPRWKAPQLGWLLAALATTVALVLAPQMLALALVAPMIMISLIVVAPAYLPALVVLAGAYSTGEIISGIYREKHQFTYDLICASTQGKLNASWSFATGIIHRGAYFLPLRWGTRISLRFGLAALTGVTTVTLLFALTGRAYFGIEQLRLLLLPLLILAVYFTNMTQTFALSHIIGLLASSFDLAKRDAMLVGLVAYGLLNALPLVGAACLYFPFRYFVFEPHPLALMSVEAGALLLIVAGRELVIVALWSALKRRMNSRLGEMERRGVMPPALISEVA
ncbi:MAG: hypothetical protein OXI30_12105 [Chloroflexota bacterium]|nr:hypothetical protein [Chloroflexota bacterium]